MPKILKKVQLLKKEELLKSLMEEKCFWVVEVVKESQSIGLAMAVLNENKKNILRSINILHMGAYAE